MIPNKTAAKIVELSAKLLTDQLKPIAYEQVVEKLCLPRCGESPNAELCPMAKRAHQCLLSLLFDAYIKFN